MLKKYLYPSLFMCFMANSNEFHYENMPVGDRPSALAGAYTSIKNSSYGMHYNPASIQGIGKTLSGTLNAFSYTNAIYEDVFPSPVGVNWDDSERHVIYNKESLERTSQSIIPGFLGYTTDLSNFTVGIYLATTDVSYEELDEFATFDYTGPIFIITGEDDENYYGVEEQGQVIENRDFSLDSEYKETQLGVSAAYKLTSSLDFGVTVSGILKKQKEIIISDIQYFEQSNYSDYSYGQVEQANTRLLDDELLIEPKFGVIYHQNNYSIGMTASKKYSLSRTLNYTDKYTLTGWETSEEYFDNQQDSYGGSESSRFDVEELQEYPLTIDLGASIVFEDIMLTMDLHHYQAVDTPVKFSEENIYGNVIDTTRQFQAVTNLSAAVELTISNSSKVAIGVFSDNSNFALDEFDDKRTDNFVLFRSQEDVDLVGLSLSLNHKTTDYDITTGFVASFGDGYGASYQLANFGGGTVNQESGSTHFKIKKQIVSLFLGIQY